MYRRNVKCKGKGAFKPPGRVNLGPVPPPPPAEEENSEALCKVVSLKRKEMELDNKIWELEEKGFKTEELKEYINLLHEYNEIKDAAQLFMGRLAIYEGVPNREIAERYNAPKSE